MIINFRNLMCSGGGGKAPVVEAISITSNGTYTASEGVDGYSPIEVSVLPTTEEKTVSIVSNGQTVVDKSADVDGMTKVTVDVAVPVPEIKLQEKTTTVNGSVVPDSGYDGLSKVDVNVPQEGGPDFTGTGYGPEYQTAITNKLQSDLDYTAQKFSEWDPNRTSANRLYLSDKNMVYTPFIDTSKVTDMEYCFGGCSNIIVLPALNTSKVTNMVGCFSGCSKLTTIPALDTSQVTDIHYCFNDCLSLTAIPALDTSKVTNMTDCFNGCESLKTIPALDTSKVTNMGSIFLNCTSLESIGELDFSSVDSVWNFFGYGEIYNLTELGGFKGLKIDWNEMTGLNKCPNLTKQSVLNVLNKLYDFRANGDTSTTRTIKLHYKSVALLNDEEKAIATNKGWTIVE